MAALYANKYGLILIVRILCSVGCASHTIKLTFDPDVHRDSILNACHSFGKEQ